MSGRDYQDSFVEADVASTDELYQDSQYVDMDLLQSSEEDSDNESLEFQTQTDYDRELTDSEQELATEAAALLPPDSEESVSNSEPSSRVVQDVPSTLIEDFRISRLGQPFAVRDTTPQELYVILSHCYRKLLGCLCGKTDTTACLPLVFEMLGDAVDLAENRHLRRGCSLDTPKQPVAAMIVYVGLTMCLVYSINLCPPPTKHNSLRSLRRHSSLSSAVTA